jgi:hypothetical protein
MKLKSLLHNKEMVTRLKRQFTEWEKIFDKGLITRTYRKLKKLNFQKAMTQ